jgi:hypothetical protein
MRGATSTPSASKAAGRAPGTGAISSGNTGALSLNPNLHSTHNPNRHRTSNAYQALHSERTNQPPLKANYRPLLNHHPVRLEDWQKLIGLTQAALTEDPTGAYAQNLLAKYGEAARHRCVSPAFSTPSGVV